MTSAQSSVIAQDAALPLVFFSYARRDGDLVRQIVATTSSPAIATWLDVEMLGADDHWQPIMADAVRRSDLFIVCVSPASLESRWVGVEIDHAVRNGKAMLAILLAPLGDAQLPVALGAARAINVASMTPAAAADTAATVIAEILGVSPSSDAAL